MLTIYYYPEVDLDTWYMFQVIDSTMPLLIMSTDDFITWNEALSEEDNESLQFALLDIYGLPSGIFNSAVLRFETPSIEDFQLTHPEFFI